MKKLEINPEEITSDLNNILNIIDKLENLDLDKLEEKDIKKIQKEAENQQEIVRNKYKNLDSKK